MKAKVIAVRLDHKDKPLHTTVHGKSVKVGDIVDIQDENTLRNLVRKGILEPHDAEAKAIDLEAPNVLTEEQADANAEKIQDKREADKEKADAASTKKR